jgi:hypothetical protein
LTKTWIFNEKVHIFEEKDEFLTRKRIFKENAHIFEKKIVQ